MIDVAPMGMGGIVFPSVKAEATPNSVPTGSAVRHRSVPDIGNAQFYGATEEERKRSWEVGRESAS